MKRDITLSVNGESYSVNVEENRTLLSVLREELALTGTKEGCGAGECGACTVLFDGKAVNSCLVLAVEADGHEITTIEGLAKDGKLHPVQEAFIKHQGVQCGFCTPGMIMSAKALLDRNPNPTEEEIKEAIAGNLCRCTGYYPIIEAIKEVAQRGEHR
ncbi:(2Fe-2S)-binding protein [Biomaibacter acetigenes]|uniref:(2Fe-2S)-binding protein n=1 Tax=Biomaibacter acetigenes TaxID=2316383 RepID=A0A3G2R8M0_9FIRM|nr:(2Fe-2S)-binding protein [Biomaibacter acetigenes]AYO31820.1 (2Fe-2S)-binding protein [Biomaibacter acetigenes]